MASENWRTIPDFPVYSVSDQGRIWNNRLEQLMATSVSNWGRVKVSLSDEDGYRHTKAVAPLVAEAFIDPPDVLSDHVIMLDGNLEHVAAVNLAWRPRWFSWRYFHQLQVPLRRHYQNLAIYNCTNRRRYRSIVACGLREGLLFEDIWDSTSTGRPVYPHHHVFKVIQRV